MAGIMSYTLYTILRFAVLRGTGSYRKAIWTLPILLFVTLFVNMFFILYKGVRNIVKIPIETACWASVVAGRYRRVWGSEVWVG